MHEALLACLSWGFENMQLNRVEAQVHPENAASLRSVERLGFKREGLLRQLGFWGGRFHDMYQYSLLRHEWPPIEAYPLSRADKMQHAARCGSPRTTKDSVL
jgi:ribosomal-protein-alanine N-acetyltransferase